MTSINEMVKEFSNNEYEANYIENVDGGSQDSIIELYENGSINSFRDIQIQAYIHVLHYFDFETEELINKIDKEIEYEYIHFKNEGNPTFENNNGETILNLEIPQENYNIMMLVDTFNDFIEKIYDNNVADKVNYSIV